MWATSDVSDIVWHDTAVGRETRWNRHGCAG